MMRVIVLVLVVASAAAVARGRWSPEVEITADRNEVLFLVTEEAEIIDAAIEVIDDPREADRSPAKRQRAALEMVDIGGGEHAASVAVPNDAFSVRLHLDYVGQGDRADSTSYSAYFLCDARSCGKVNHTEYLLATGLAERIEFEGQTFVVKTRQEQGGEQ